MQFEMKKFLVTILTVLYVASSVNAGINLHFCCDRLSSVSAGFGQAAGKPAVCKMQHSYTGKNCCKDEFKQVKVSHAQDVPSSVILPAVHFVALIPASLPEIHTPEFSSVSEGNFSPHSPPLRKEIPVYLLHCSFVI